MANELNMCGNYLIIFLFTVQSAGITFIISLDVDTTGHRRIHFSKLIKEKEPNRREKQGQATQHVVLLQSSLITDYYTKSSQPDVTVQEEKPNLNGSLIISSQC